jgi:hypothetical protein
MKKQNIFADVHGVQKSRCPLRKISVGKNFALPPRRPAG